MDGPENIQDELRAGKLDRLIRERGSSPVHNPKWSRFVRRMRLLLPLVALAIFAVVFVWSDIRHSNIIPAQDAAKLAPSIGKNELVNPHFDSTDSDGQPYSLTAKRAVQGKDDENLVMLDEPTGEMKLKNGEQVNVRADRGSFRQDQKTLLLRGDVRLNHDKGYEMTMEELDLDIQRNTAFSQVDVAGTGPEGTLNAKGLEGWGSEGRLVFTGPAKLVLTNMSGGERKLVP